MSCKEKGTLVLRIKQVGQVSLPASSPSHILPVSSRALQGVSPLLGELGGPPHLVEAGWPGKGFSVEEATGSRAHCPGRSPRPSPASSAICLCSISILESRFPH